MYEQWKQLKKCRIDYVFVSNMIQDGDLLMYLDDAKLLFALKETDV